MAQDYTLYCKLIDGDAFSFDFLGYEDLSHVLQEVEELTDCLGIPPDPAMCSEWGIVSADMTEFAAMRQSC
jgi:hypothetical protein